MESNSKYLRFVDVSLSLGEKRLLGPLNLTIKSGEIVTVMGPSGSGKSTLIEFACGTLDPAFSVEGKIILNDRNVTLLPPEKRRMGILFQDDLLFPHLSVWENLSFGMPRDLSISERRKLINNTLVEAGLKMFSDRDPSTLSGGQRARIALLRTLVADPQALLLDEPFSKLDAPLREKFRSYVFQHARNKSLPTLLVTHDPLDADAAGGPVLEIVSAFEENDIAANVEAAS